MTLPDPMATWLERQLPDGWHLEWVVDDDFELAEGTTYQCRQTNRGVRCPNVSVAIIWRPTYSASKRKRAWRYCADHLYGRVIDDGKVWSLHTVRDEVPS